MKNHEKPKCNIHGWYYMIIPSTPIHVYLFVGSTMQYCIPIPERDVGVFSDCLKQNPGIHDCAGNFCISKITWAESVRLAAKCRSHWILSIHKRPMSSDIEWYWMVSGGTSRNASVKHVTKDSTRDFLYMAGRTARERLTTWPCNHLSYLICARHYWKVILINCRNEKTCCVAWYKIRRQNKPWNQLHLPPNLGNSTCSCPLLRCTRQHIRTSETARNGGFP